MFRQAELKEEREFMKCSLALAAPIKADCTGKLEAPVLGLETFAADIYLLNLLFASLRRQSVLGAFFTMLVYSSDVEGQNGMK